MKATNLIKTAIFVSLTTSISSFADLKSDIQLLRTLAPVQSDVAGIQAALLYEGTTEESAMESAKTNYLIRDFNKDGIKDILVIFEQDPTLKNDEDQPCDEMNWETSCRPEYGDRVIQFWQGQPDGQTFRKISENKDIVMRADDGGMMGDPIQGIELNSKGSVVLSFYGGSAWRWGYSYTLQFRKDDFYQVGIDSMNFSSIDHSWNAKSTNLITGKVIESQGENIDEETSSKTYHIPVKPLVNLSNIEVIVE